MKIRALYLMIVSLIALAFSPTVLAQDSNNLVETHWQLVSYGATGSEVMVSDGSVITLEFIDTQQAGGSGGCNTYGAGYTIEGNTITFTEIVSTLMACADSALMDQEQAYFQLLGVATGYELSGDQLIITSDDGQQLTFTRTDTAATSLKDSQWHLVSYDSIKDMLPGSTITLELGSDNLAAGSGGCNSYSSNYQFTENSISFGPVVSTKMACADSEITAQEQRYFEALQAASAYTLSDDQLVISYGEGEELVFERAGLLSDSQWQLQAIGDRSTVTSVTGGAMITLEFNSENQVSGFGGCNSYNGTYTLLDDVITFSEIISTRKACVDNAVMEQEHMYFGALASATGYQFLGDELTITYGDGQQLILTRTSRLSNSQWQLESYSIEGEETPVSEISIPTLEFGLDNQVSGSGGCNTYTGSYQLQGNTIHFSELVSTEMACLDNGISEQEQTFFDALLSGSHYELAEESLIIEYGDEQHLIFTQLDSTIQSG